LQALRELSQPIGHKWMPALDVGRGRGAEPVQRATDGAEHLDLYNELRTYATAVSLRYLTPEHAGRSTSERPR